MRRPEQFELLSGVAEGIRLLNEIDVKVIVVTNQSGVARGYFTEEDLKEIHKRMIDELEKREAKIDAIYYCPHHPAENCKCRKPGTLMLKRAANDFNLDLSKCFVVGDRKLDVDTAINAGCTSILVPSPETEPSTKADHVAVNFLEAARWIVKRIHESLVEK
jgi:histidinol-phosphate phosphatase family protein